MTPSKELAKRDEKERVFEWTEPRKKALKLFLRGSFITDIAKDVGVSRMTIQRWLKEPVFIAKVQQRLEERQTANTLRQSHFTSTVTNDLMEGYATALKRFKKAQKHRKSGMKAVRHWEFQSGLLEHMEKLGKEFERMRNQHRLDHGQATSHSKHVSTSLVLHKGKVDHNHEAGVSFRGYMEAHRNEIVVNPKDPPAQQMLDATVQVLQGTDFLEKLAEEEEGEQEAVK